MKITEEAKKIITEAFETNDYNCLKGMLQESCCGKSLYFVLDKSDELDKLVSINGVSVLLDDEASQRAESVTITTEDGKLYIQDDSQSGCC